MKKIAITVSSLIFLLIIPIYTYAVTIHLNLATDMQYYKITEEDKSLIVMIQLGDFVNIPDNTALGYTATIEYDKSIFENITISGKNGWDVTYNYSNDRIEGDTEKALENTDIAELSF